jgi:cation diffusion facilitator family transporter
MRWVRDYSPNVDDTRLYRQALILTLVGNILLAAAKGIVAYLTNSVALYSDAANSASDVVYSLLIILGLWMARQPPDLSHPQGHSRFEPLVGLVVTASMTFAGFVAAKASIDRFLIGGLAVEPGLPTIVLLVSAAVKAFMFWRIRWIGLKLNSPTFATAAKDNLSDVLTSMAAFLGAVGSKYVNPLADPIGGILVALWIFKAVFEAVKENLGFLTGAGADPELLQKIVAVAQSVQGVQRVHHLMSEYTGPRLVVDMHINVDGSMTLSQAHLISDEIIAKVQELPEVDRVYVHIEPEGYD